jgi:hypothetical protein
MRNVKGFLASIVDYPTKRIPRSERRAGFSYYETTYEGDNWAIPRSIMKRATTNFNGTLVLNEPIEWPEKAEEISLSVAQGWAILNSLPKADDL